NRTHNVIGFVTRKGADMRSIRCRVCKSKFKPPGTRGPQPRYCSPACRQKAYRKRAANPHRFGLRAFQNDLQKIQDRDNRVTAAVKVLEDAGLVVHLERGKVSILPKGVKPPLRVIPGDRTPD